ncbi:hypothetical protein, partial [Bradyrhizobium sp.]|uniref:hypothetical protein n=1 Tax=Bradyrhizobium sp. TaxID=376 RepID=UPI0025B93E13
MSYEISCITSFRSGQALTKVLRHQRRGRQAGCGMLLASLLLQRRAGGPMSTFDNPFDSDRKLQAGCACGQHRSAAE